MSRRTVMRNLFTILLVASLATLIPTSVAYATAGGFIEPGLPKNMRLSGPAITGYITIETTEVANHYNIAVSLSCLGQPLDEDYLDVPLFGLIPVGETFGGLTANDFQWATLGYDLAWGICPYYGMRTVVGIHDFENTGTAITAYVTILLQVPKPAPPQ
jgi:hypothetical protein